MTGGCAESFLVERGANLLWGASEVLERPEELDVGVPHGADGGEGALGVGAHSATDGVELYAESVEACSGCGSCLGRAEESRTRRGQHRLEEVASFHTGGS